MKFYWSWQNGRKIEISSNFYSAIYHSAALQQEGQRIVWEQIYIRESEPFTCGCDSIKYEHVDTIIADLNLHL